MHHPDAVPGQLDEEFSRPVESIMRCEDFKSNFARRLSNRYTSRSPVTAKRQSSLKLRTADAEIVDNVSLFDTHFNCDYFLVKSSALVTVIVTNKQMVFMIALILQVIINVKVLTVTVKHIVLFVDKLITLNLFTYKLVCLQSGNVYF